MRYTTRIIVPPRVRRSGPSGSPGGAYGPQVLGVRKTFGFGDPLGLAAAAHVTVASAHPEFAPVFTQQSPAELSLLGRTAADAISGVARAVSAARFRPPWGADADGLKSAQEVAVAAEAGFTCFTFDPSEFVRPGVADLSTLELQAAVQALVDDGDLPEHWAEPYLDRVIGLPGNHELRVAAEPLQRAVVRYAPAIVHCARLSSALARSTQGRPFEVEVSLENVDTPTSTLEHLFIGLELEARGVRLTGLGLRHGPGGAPGEWETQLHEHAAVAEFCGPYKLCFRETSVDPELYPIIGRACGDALHFKDSTSSYLEALRVASQVDPGLFRELLAAALPDLASPADFPFEGPPRPPADFAALLLALARGQDAAGRPFRQTVLELLERHADLYSEGLVACFERRFEQLNVG